VQTRIGMTACALVRCRPDRQEGISTSVALAQMVQLKAVTAQRKCNRWTGSYPGCLSGNRLSLNSAGSLLREFGLRDHQPPDGSVATCAACGNITKAPRGANHSGLPMHALCRSDLLGRSHSSESICHKSVVATQNGRCRCRCGYLIRCLRFDESYFWTCPGSLAGDTLEKPSR